MKQVILSIVTLLMCSIAQAGSIDASASASGGASCIVNADSTLTFSWCGGGKHVFVEGDFESADGRRKYNELHPRKIRMELGSDSCYHLTTPGLVPELYTYTIVVDGRRVTDGINADTAWQADKMYNIVTVAGSPQSALYEQPEMSGQLIRTTWYDRHSQRTRRLCIYLPAAYMNESVRLPVLYLLHGISGYEGSWAERGRVVQIMENLIAAGRAEPMIVVMPDCNVDTCAEGSLHPSLWQSIPRYPQHKHDRGMEYAIDDLDHYISSTYHVSGRRFIAGLSSGARIAANIVQHRPDMFEAVGLFSPVIRSQRSEIRDQNSEVRYYIYAGRSDIFVSSARQYHRGLERGGICHTYIETDGAHYWRNWRRYLSDFVQQISAEKRP